MLKFTFIFALTLFISCTSGENHQPGTNTTNDKPSQQDDMNYSQQLAAIKEDYPFEKWRENYQHGLEQYTQENCDKAKRIFDHLIERLNSLGVNADPREKVELFKTAVLSLNRLNEEVEGLIETGEREDLCELIDRVAIAARLNPKDYGGGEGIADEWREW